MLRSLTIRDFVIVDRLELDFESGFTTLTGETGAGKSIMIDALSLALGARAEANVVRVGQTRAEIAAEFDLSSVKSARKWLAENELAAAGEGNDEDNADDANVCLFRRVLDVGGRSKSFINGNSVTLSQMRDLAGRLIDIHGQHEHQTLLRRDAQLALLDDFAQNDALLADVRERHGAWSQLANIRAAREANEAAIAREFEDLTWQIGEVEKFNFTVLRWEDTQADQRRLANAASLIAAAEAAVNGLSEADNDVLSRIDELSGDLGDAAETDPALSDSVALINSAAVELREAVTGLRHYLRKLDVDPGRLADLDREIADVQEIARKFRIEPARIPEFLAQKRDRLAALGGGQSLDALIEQERAALNAFMDVAKKLTRSRQAAAKKFASDVTRSLQQLAMAGGKFAVEFSAREPSANGLEGCEFQVSAHEGQPLGPLAKIASGGELSRISLAIQMMASAKGGVGTMIFDEVDAGIGGRVAEVVGRLLRALGQNHQVLAVTHLPQVAACAQHQFQVAKAAKEGVVTTSIVPLTDASRVDEIARMLGGITITVATKRAAAEMLENAARLESKD
ncbi:MAG: DNA repair protein RecN [Betaproteobacteria bacterium]|nr:DNA repair protein RecN [Betaproteobacteria bacterium]